ncbi:MAG: FAD-dependent monooxygenase [Nitrospirota bacterium]|nr:FAD-dependent monooxygenase [Nitrospirota bacterium]
MTERTDVVVIGAGGGGAVLGLALAQKGIKALVLEQASGPPGGLRGEILQPNGQQILDRLGLLDKLPADATRPVRYFHFCRVGGAREGARLGAPGAGGCERLCTIDYGMLPPPFNRAVVTLPNVAHHAILKELETRAPGSLRYGATFKRLLREGNQIVGVEAECGGRPMTVSAKLVVGADGARSHVRDALGIAAKLHLYPEGYLIAILERPKDMEEARYFVGKKTILGAFPAAGDKAYLFYMIPAGSMQQVKDEGLEALRQRWLAIDPTVEPMAKSLVDWKQTAYMPTGRVKAKTWVADGAVLIGDAAHAINPHASQGRMQAMVDAMALADLIPRWLECNDWSASALAEYERVRRPQVDMLQKLADEQVLFWNTGNPLLAYLRDRVFRGMERNKRLGYQVLATTAGFRSKPPFGLLDRLMIAGFLPDPHADRLPADAAAREA